MSCLPKHIKPHLKLAWLLTRQLFGGRRCILFNTYTLNIWCQTSTIWLPDIHLQLGISAIPNAILHSMHSVKPFHVKWILWIHIACTVVIKKKNNESLIKFTLISSICFLKNKILEINTICPCSNKTKMHFFYKSLRHKNISISLPK